MNLYCVLSATLELCFTDFYCNIYLYIYCHVFLLYMHLNGAQKFDYQDIQICLKKHVILEFTLWIFQPRVHTFLVCVKSRVHLSFLFIDLIFLMNAQNLCEN